MGDSLMTLTTEEVLDESVFTRITSDKAQAAALQLKRDERFSALYVEKMAELTEQFSNVGIEYRLLLERVAKSHAALSCVDEGLDPGMSGLDYDRRTGELRKNIQVILAAAAKNKGEALQQARQDGAATLMEVALRVLPPDMVKTLGDAIQQELSK